MYQTKCQQFFFKPLPQYNTITTHFNTNV